MGEIRTRDKRDKLRLLYDLAGSSGQPLASVLMQSLRDCDTAVANGAFLSSTSEAGGSVSQLPLQDYSPTVARRLIGELYDLYDSATSALTALGTLSGNPVTADAQIFGVMIGNLVRITRYRNDYTGSRYGAGTFISA